MPILFIISFIYLFIISFILKRDVSTPSKFFLISCFVFWGGVFFNNYTLPTYITCFVMLLFCFVLIFTEQRDVCVEQAKKLYVYRPNRLFNKIWLLTLIPVIVQILLIKKMGGFEAYILSINLRVKEWEGLGLYLVLTRFILILNVFYFLILFKLKKISTANVLLYLLHFFIFVIIALLSGSRSTLLVNLVLLLISFYLFRQKLSALKILTFCLLVVVSVIVLEAVRCGGISYDERVLTSELSGDKKIKFKASNFEYEIFQIEEIYNKKEKVMLEPELEMTYLFEITNLISRMIWPNKPKSGGVVFTNNYHYIHDSYLNYSTGFVVEGILNFGYFYGPIIGFLL